MSGLLDGAGEEVGIEIVALDDRLGQGEQALHDFLPLLGRHGRDRGNREAGAVETAGDEIGEALFAQAAEGGVALEQHQRGERVGQGMEAAVVVDGVAGVGFGVGDELREIHIHGLHQSAACGAGLEGVVAEAFAEERGGGGFDGVAMQAALDQGGLDLWIPSETPVLFEDGLAEGGGFALYLADSDAQEDQPVEERRAGGVAAVRACRACRGSCARGRRIRSFPGVELVVEVVDDGQPADAIGDAAELGADVHLVDGFEQVGGISGAGRPCSSR